VKRLDGGRTLAMEAKTNDTDDDGVHITRRPSAVKTCQNAKQSDDDIIFEPKGELDYFPVKCAISMP